MTSRMPTPAVAQPAQHGEQALDLVGRQGGGGLVEHEHAGRAGVVVDGAGDRHDGPLGAPTAMRAVACGSTWRPRSAIATRAASASARHLIRPIRLVR